MVEMFPPICKRLNTFIARFAYHDGVVVGVNVPVAHGCIIPYGQVLQGIVGEVLIQNVLVNHEPKVINVVGINHVVWDTPRVFEGSRLK